MLADLHNTLGQYQRTVETIRRGCRWLQGRASQKFWDAIPDDREWDIPGPNGEPTRAVTAGEIQPGMHLLDINARQRLAIARIKLGDSQEGKVCLPWICSLTSRLMDNRCTPTLFYPKTSLNMQPCSVKLLMRTSSGEHMQKQGTSTRCWGAMPR